MTRSTAEQLGNANYCAFLDMIAFSEGTARVPGSDDGYNVIVGGSLFPNYADHPRVKIALKDKKGQPIINQMSGLPLVSTAAGRYQLMARYFTPYANMLHLADFSPEAQDRIALQQAKEQHALDLIAAGQIEKAIARCSNIWASFPGSPYKQPTYDLPALLAAYKKAGGTLAATT